MIGPRAHTERVDDEEPTSGFSASLKAGSKARPRHQRGGDEGAELARQGQGVDPVDEGVGAAGGDAIAVLPEQGPDEGNVASAGADEGLADTEAAAHLALGVGEAMSGTIGAEQIGVGQGAGIAAIGLDPPGAGGVHEGEVGVGDDHLVAEVLETRDSGRPIRCRWKPR